MAKSKINRRNPQNTNKKTAAVKQPEVSSAENSKPLSKKVSFWVAILTFPATIIALYFGYLAVAEPDLRYIPNINPRTNFTQRVGNECFYYLWVNQPFENLSMKGGYIGDVNPMLMSLDLKAELKLVGIDKIKIGWGERQEIEAKLSLSFPPEFCATLNQRKKPFMFGMRYFDNTGKQITSDTNGVLAERTYNVDFSAPQTHLPQ